MRVSALKTTRASRSARSPAGRKFSLGFGSLALAGAVALALPTALLAAATVGEVTKVEVGAFGTPPEQERAALKTKDSVVRDELLETLEKGGLSVLFIDGTSFHLGGNSQATVDEFLFTDGTEGEGQLVNLGTGVFRFFSNNPAKSEKVRFATTTSVIGVRGTDFVVRHDTNGTTVVGTVTGEVDVTNRSNDGQAIVRAGDYVTVTSSTRQLAVRDAPVAIEDFACWLARDPYICALSASSPDTQGNTDVADAPDPEPDPDPDPDPDPPGGGSGGSGGTGGSGGSGGSGGDGGTGGDGGSGGDGGDGGSGGSGGTGGAGGAGGAGGSGGAGGGGGSGGSGAS